MRYFIDAYNLLFRLQESREPLQNDREKLIDQLTLFAATRKERITLVFDAHSSEDEEWRGHKGSLEIVYTAPGQSADDYIVRSIEIAKNPKKMVVITSDLNLARRIHGLGARSESIETFLDFVEHRLKPKKSGKREEATPDEMSRWQQLFEKQWKKILGEDA